MRKKLNFVLSSQLIEDVSTVRPNRYTPLSGRVYEMIIIWMGCKSCRRCLKDHKWFCGQRWNEWQTESTAKSWGARGGKAKVGPGPKRFGLQLSSGLQFAAPLVLAIIGAHLNGIKIALSLYLLKRFVLTRLTRDTAKRGSHRDRPQND